MEKVEKIPVHSVRIPADVPYNREQAYRDHFLTATRGTGRLMLFAGDQKIEHLNDDFYGEMEMGTIPEDDASPEHLFRIAADSVIGAFATQRGLIAKYGKDFPRVPYIVKMNSKSNLVKASQAEPGSKNLSHFRDILTLKENGLNIVGVGYTIYLGSELEADMLAEAGQLVADAHREGMLVVLWIYPRGKAVKQEKDSHLIAGACGVAAALGADFVKVNYPKAEGKDSAELLAEGILAAGRTGVITAGGSFMPEKEFLVHAHKILSVGGRGNATGRNIHQKSLENAIRMCNAISSITFGGYDPEEALEVYEGKREFTLS